MTSSPSISHTTAENASIPTFVIRPPKKWVQVDFHELWEYRELLYSFVARDVKILSRITMPTKRMVELHRWIGIRDSLKKYIPLVTETKISIG